MEYPKLALRKGKGQSISRRHPWVFSGAISTETKSLNNGDKVFIVNDKKEIIATGHFSDGSIAVRILSFEKSIVNEEFYFRRIQNAYNLRLQSGLADSSETNAYRLIHAEGDQLPGLVVDFYNGVAVVQTHSAGMSRDYPLIERALRKSYGEKLTRVIHKRAHGEDEVEERIENETPTVDILEHGNAFRVNYETGQKTGFFLDQRENRALISRYSKDKKILNAFSYSGGFSIYALKGGAQEVHSLDSSARAMDLVAENIELNKMGKANHQALKADALEYLNSPEANSENYDIIILDPPAFAKHRSARHKAVQAYKRLNERALRIMKPGGILITFSCSQVVTPDLFYNTIAAAAMEAGRHVQILHHLHQPEDHPISIFHPEGEYLKGLVLAVS